VHTLRARVAAAAESGVCPEPALVREPLPQPRSCLRVTPGPAKAVSGACPRGSWYVLGLGSRSLGSRGGAVLGGGLASRAAGSWLRLSPQMWTSAPWSTAPAASCAATPRALSAAPASRATPCGTAPSVKWQVGPAGEPGLSEGLGSAPSPGHPCSPGDNLPRPGRQRNADPGGGGAGPGPSGCADPSLPAPALHRDRAPRPGVRPAPRNLLLADRGRGAPYSPPREGHVAPLCRWEGVRVLGAVAELRWVPGAGLPPQPCLFFRGRGQLGFASWPGAVVVCLELLCLRRCRRGEQHLRGLVHRAAVLGQQPPCSHLCGAGRWPGLRDSAGEGRDTGTADSLPRCKVRGERARAGPGLLGE